MLKNDTVKLILRRLILAALIVITSLVQNSADGLFAKFNIGFFFLIPLTVSTAMFEKEFAGLFFGMLAGALWDLSSPVPDGVFTLFFTLAAFLCGLLTHFIFRNSFKSALVFTTAVFLLFSAVSLVFNCLLKDPSGARYYVSVFCLRSFPVTLAALPFAYYPVRFIEKHLHPEN